MGKDEQNVKSDYQTRLEENSNKAFIEIDNGGSKRWIEEKKGVKLHISVNEAQKELAYDILNRIALENKNLIWAYKFTTQMPGLILQQLNKKIGEVKIHLRGPELLYESIEQERAKAQRLIEGSQFTVYIGINNNSDYSELLQLIKDISSALEFKEIQSGVCPRSDLILSPYVSVRYDEAQAYQGANEYQSAFLALNIPVIKNLMSAMLGNEYEPLILKMQSLAVENGSESPKARVLYDLLYQIGTTTDEDKRLEILKMNLNNKELKTHRKIGFFTTPNTIMLLRSVIHEVEMKKSPLHQHLREK